MPAHSFILQDRRQIITESRVIITMLMEFTGISVSCSMRQSWNSDLLRKVNQVFKEFTGHAAHASMCNGWFQALPLDVNEGDYIIEFTINCDVSSDVEKEQKRCQSIITVLRKLVDETFCAKASLDGSELVRVRERSDFSNAKR